MEIATTEAEKRMEANESITANMGCPIASLWRKQMEGSDSDKMKVEGEGVRVYESGNMCVFYTDTQPEL